MLAIALLLTLAATGASAAATADEPSAPPTTAGGQVAEPTPESTTTPATPETAGTEVTTPTAPVLNPTPPPTQVVEVTPPPVVQTPQPAPPVEVNAPATSVTEVATVEGTAPSKPIAEEPQASAQTAAEAALSVAAPSAGQIAPSATPPPAAATQSAVAPDTPPAEASSLVLGRLAADSAGRSPRPPSAPGATAITSSAPVVRLSPAQRAAELSCQLSGMAGFVTDNCRAELSGQVSLSAPAAGFRSPIGSRTDPPNDGYGNSVGGGHPVVPAPAPAPSGAVGGSAAGGSGVALSGFFTLAGLLLLAAPLALRRLRLSCQPWRTAFFVLIPERPG
jgi:hypothetical protein